MNPGSHNDMNFHFDKDAQTSCDMQRLACVGSLLTREKQ
jgi:hypothetical protein